MATFSDTTRTGYNFNGFNPPYKIGNDFTFPTITGRNAPGQTGSAAQPCLIYSVSIDVQGQNTSSASTQFAVWNSNGSSGYYSNVFSLTSTSGTNASSTTANLTNPKPVFGNTGYIVGFTKRNTQTFTWDIDDGKSGDIYQDNAGTTGNFDEDAVYRSSSSLVFKINYYTLPLAPTAVVPSKGVGGLLVSWSAPTDNGGTSITGYRIDRSPDGSTWTNIVANTSSVATSYTDTTAVGGNTYYYRVAAHNLVSTTHGGSYSSPYSASSASFLYTTATANNATSVLVAAVFNPNITPTIFADDGSGLPFNGIEVAYGAEQLFNYVTAEADTVETAQATSSQILYGVRSFSVSNLLTVNAEDTLQVANEILWASYDPEVRVASLSVVTNDLSDAEMVTLLSLDLDSLVQVKFTPNGVGDQFVRMGRVIGVSWEVTIESAVVTFNLQSAENQVFTLDSEQFGILDEDILG
jgi:hypothetical protein